MNQKELSNLISSNFVTWETIKQTLMSRDNILVTGSNFSDDSIIFQGVLIFNAGKGITLSLSANQFVILQSGSNSINANSFSNTQAYDLTNNLAVLPASLGSLFTKAVIPGTDLTTYNFLLFRVN